MTTTADKSPTAPTRAVAAARHLPTTKSPTAAKEIPTRLGGAASSGLELIFRIYILIILGDRAYEMTRPLN